MNIQDCFHQVTKFGFNSIWFEGILYRNIRDAVKKFPHFSRTKTSPWVALQYDCIGLDVDSSP